MKHMYIKTCIGIAASAVYIWIFLFGSAGSLLYWQGWVSWMMFMIPTILSSVYFLKINPEFMVTRLRVGPWAEKEPSQKIIQTCSAFSFLLLLVISGVDYRYHWSSVPFMLTLLGYLVMLIGFWIVFVTFQQNSFASAIIEKQKKQKVISSGVYGIIRHPMYLGASLIVGALPVALGSFWANLSVVVMGVFLVLRILHEEQYLRTQLLGYDAYCARVRFRLIPHVW